MIDKCNELTEHIEKLKVAKAAEKFGNVSAVALAAQNCSEHNSGAYTGVGEKAVKNRNKYKRMLKEAGE